jgi:heme exporter protein D
MKLTHKIFAAILAIMLVALSSISLAQDLDMVRSEGFTLVPTKPNTINERKFIFEIKPGENAQDSVTIKNLSDSQVTFKLYGADPTLSAQGTLAYKTRQSGGEAEGSWVRFNNPEITLAKGEERIETFTISVPEKTPYGDYRAGIAMEKSKQDINDSNITIATRVILHAEIKVTANPNIVPKKGDILKEASPEPENNKWKSMYFWVSLALFIASLTALIVVTIQERKKNAVKETRSNNNTAKKTTAKKSTAKNSAKKPAASKAPKTSTKKRKK